MVGANRAMTAIHLTNDLPTFALGYPCEVFFEGSEGGKAPRTLQPVEGIVIQDLDPGFVQAHLLDTIGIALLKRIRHSIANTHVESSHTGEKGQVKAQANVDPFAIRANGLVGSGGWVLTTETVSLSAFPSAEAPTGFGECRWQGISAAG